MNTEKYELSELTEDEVKQLLDFKELAVLSSELDPPRYCIPVGEKTNKWVNMASQALRYYYGIMFKKDKFEKFRHCVTNKLGEIEMMIFSDDDFWFTLHFPRWEFLGKQPNKMRLPDISALLFAYDEKEYEKFTEKWEQYIKRTHTWLGEN